MLKGTRSSPAVPPLIVRQFGGSLLSTLAIISQYRLSYGYGGSRVSTSAETTFSDIFIYQNDLAQPFLVLTRKDQISRFLGFIVFSVPSLTYQF